MGCTPSSPRAEHVSGNLPVGGAHVSPLVYQYQQQKMRQRRNLRQNLSEDSNTYDESFLPIDSIEVR